MELFCGEHEAQRECAARDAAVDIEIEREELIARGFQWFTVIGHWNGEKRTQEICAETDIDARQRSNLEDIIDVMSQEELVSA